jgi:predicted nucleic acid-binding protein
MTFLDSNYFLRFLVEPTSPALEAMSRTARELFRAVARGEEQVTTSEVVLHEVIYVLGSKKYYGKSPAEIAAAMKEILGLPSFKLPGGQKALYRRARDLYAVYPRLGFADAVVAASGQGTGTRLATFDRDFDSIPGIVRDRPLDRDDPE